MSQCAKYYFSTRLIFSPFFKTKPKRPCFQYRTTVVIELYRVRCPDCGLKTEKTVVM